MNAKPALLPLSRLRRWRWGGASPGFGSPSPFWLCRVGSGVSPLAGGRLELEHDARSVWHSLRMDVAHGVRFLTQTGRRGCGGRGEGRGFGSLARVCLPNFKGSLAFPSQIRSACWFSGSLAILSRTLGLNNDLLCFAVGCGIGVWWFFFYTVAPP